ncbi:mechanosensitive ion channel protein [Shewanella aestuarii]|uniref:Small-conductance mechanosensitive channel n=2 Tax=Shewanella aestuarii TaxID=1028752 RepID=A0ABT0L131_9GAMM|nr:mechanosensitive ion channel family protein [Shewanella aestuarii]MCL1117431.1 mechanosensitive ion channel family protein [Shewanella aestuarii]GGN75979.1 mechanosensitive ion channel protein [Shewanella aestuarii]
MLKMVMSLGLTLACLLGASNVHAQSPAIPEQTTEQVAQVSTDTQQKIAALTAMIEDDVNSLAQSQGEIKAIAEYRIKNKTLELRGLIDELINAENIDYTFVTPLVQSQLTFLDKVSHYLNEDIVRLKNSITNSSNDEAILLQVSEREFQRDHYLKAELQTINWAEKVNIDVANIKQRLRERLIIRADKLQSLVTYTQQELQQAVADATSAGKDISADQKLRVTNLKERLKQNSTSLTIAAELLDQLEIDTAHIKQTLFSVSGDITQDVLNFNVASSLIEEWMSVAKNQALDNGPSVTFKIVVFSLILFLSSLVAKVVTRIATKAVSSSKLKFSQLLQDFFISLSSKAIFAIGLLVALSQLGFELGPLLAGFGIAGVIIGFALQDTLSNFASGMMILIYRPFDVGDLINAAGVTGRVSHMSLVSTTIKTLDNQRLIIPNNKIWGDTINNITAEHQRRVDLVFGISYSDNIEHAETILKDIVEQHPKVQATPEPIVKLHTLGESSVDFIVRPWVKPDDYWDVYWDITRAVKMRFDAEGISIPFPQRDVHIYQK